ncbi:hypothetical protein HYDPIDRAFT_98351 [Hydnomerulius pinastri MD-312]|uniref:Uncharacterized protein n=1 Tax=Hydnomerulius pinastri MD-312 TaxID=994086 RepID=A0A0C9VRY2_9AGAM|nr:hypothetical protein HYDPIDRAFT_98351 [Hydnomerulius pinastri MD-312]
MHLIFENAIPNLIELWTGAFKGLDHGTHNYELVPTVWDAIGAATASSGPSLPYAFCSRPPNIATYEKAQCTADSWSFWTQYIAPVIMENRFTSQQYYDHFVDFIKLLRTCLQFELTRDDVNYIRQGYKNWVLKYEERFYYQYSPDRLAVCTVTAHALLHIADSIEATGPVWTAWAFPMERFCGSLQGAIKSRRYPYASINNYVVNAARLTQLQLIYNLQHELSLRKVAKESYGFSHDDYPTCVLLPPHSNAPLEPRLLRKIINHLTTTYNSTVTVIRAICASAKIEQWGKVRRLQGGDTVHASALVNAREDTRDATYVRYEALVDKYARQPRRKPEYTMETFYGRLAHIFVVTLPPSTPLGNAVPTTHILAAIETCEIERSRPDVDIHYYSKLGALDMVDITCLQCLVGRIPHEGRWAIIDRSGDLARAIYAADEGGEAVVS